MLTSMTAFLLGLFLICASTLVYEVVLTRLLSVICWYYLAFVSISMAMFGMTAGALSIQLRPDLFTGERVKRRLAESAFAAAISTPLAVMTMLAIPVDVSASLETVYSFLLFSSVIAVPFFFSGVVVCLSLTRSPFPMGRVYFTDLAGAAAGCIASVALLQTVDAPSVIFLTSGILFVGAWAYACYAEDARIARRSLYGVVLMLVVGVANASTLHGFQPIWSKGSIDRRVGILAEVWNPISKIQAGLPKVAAPAMWGPSPKMPAVQVEEIGLTIDNDAATVITRFTGDLAPLAYLRYDVTSLAAQLRSGGTAAVIGVGGGRDVLTCAVTGFRRIVGIEVNGAMVDLVSRRLGSFSGFDKIQGLELHHDEGRSYLTRSGERFDLIQVSLVDTWAATSAGALTLSENALYTVDGWRVFYNHLKPGGIITFSRWLLGAERTQTFRLFSVARATLLAEGALNPDAQMALVQSGPIATLLVSNQPFGKQDIQKLEEIAGEMAFGVLMMPGQPTDIPEIRQISAAKSVDELLALRGAGEIDFSPPFDSSPYFFNAVHLTGIPGLLRSGAHGANLRAILFLAGFLIAALLLVLFTLLLPATIWTARRPPGPAPLTGGIVYFIAIGLGFMLVEMAMMQQLSIFLGHPIYALVVVLTGLILSSGLGSLLSDKWPVESSWQSRAPSISAAALVVIYSATVVPAIHVYTAGLLWQRVLVCLALVTPCGLLLGFCFPVGMRWMNVLAQDRNLPWMWALNGAAGTLGSFVAIIVSMDVDIRTCALSGAACYLLAGLSMPAKARKDAGAESDTLARGTPKSQNRTRLWILPRTARFSKASPSVRMSSEPSDGR